MHHAYILFSIHHQDLAFEVPEDDLIDIHETNFNRFVLKNKASHIWCVGLVESCYVFIKEDIPCEDS